MELNYKIKLINDELTKVDNISTCKFCNLIPEYSQSDRLLVLRCPRCMTPARGYISLQCIKSDTDAKVASRRLISNWIERNKR